MEGINNVLTHINDFMYTYILEKSAASLATKYAEEHELEEIMKLAHQFPKDNSASNFAEFNHLNNIFHMSVIRAAHNTVMSNISVGVMENLSRIQMLDSRHLDFSNEHEEHIAIAQALLDRNSINAEKLIIEHITELQERTYISHGAFQ